MRQPTRRCREVMQNSTAARANEARTTLARRRLPLAPRHECGAERSRAVACELEKTTRTTEPTAREAPIDTPHDTILAGGRSTSSRARCCANQVWLKS